MHYLPGGRGGHDKIICSLFYAMVNKGVYSRIREKEEYHLRNGHAGEVDLYGISKSGRDAVVIEVKSSNRAKSREKAHKQLDRAAQYLKERYGVDHVWKIYAYGDSPYIHTEIYR